MKNISLLGVDIRRRGYFTLNYVTKTSVVIGGKNGSSLRQSGGTWGNDVSWHLLSYNDDPNPGLSYTQMVGGVYCLPNKKANKQWWLSTLIGLQYYMGAKGYSAKTCALLDVAPNVYNNPKALVTSPEGDIEVMDYSDTYYINRGLSYEEHSMVQVVEDTTRIVVRYKGAYDAIYQIQCALNRIDEEEYCEEDHDFVATCYQLLIHMGYTHEQIELILSARGWVEDKDEDIFVLTQLT